jgi:hypothetical protein
MKVFLRAFRLTMPQDERFIERFCEHARLIVPAAEAFRAMSDDGQAQLHAAEISRLEEEADKVTRDTVIAIHRTFVTASYPRSEPVLDRNGPASRGAILVSRHQRRRPSSSRTLAAIAVHVCP